MQRFTVEQVKEMMQNVSDEMLNKAVLKGALKLSDEKIDTIMFVFGLCYLAERDIGDVISRAWEKASQLFPQETVGKAKKMFNDFLSNDKSSVPTIDEVLSGLDQEKSSAIMAVVNARYRPKQLLDFEKMESFGEKIRAYTAVYGNNNVASILWCLKGLRDDISHGRIDGLSYDEQPLIERKTKEKMLIDYLEAVSNPDHSNPKLIKHLNLSVSESQEVERVFESLFGV